MGSSMASTVRRYVRVSRLHVDDQLPGRLGFLASSNATIDPGRLNRGGGKD